MGLFLIAKAEDFSATMCLISPAQRAHLVWCLPSGGQIGPEDLGHDPMIIYLGWLYQLVSRLVQPNPSGLYTASFNFVFWAFRDIHMHDAFITLTS